MINNKIKNVILLISVLVCIVLSSRIWLQLPNFLNYDSEKKEMVKETELKLDIWSLVKPVKAVIKFNENYTILYSAEDKELWKKTV
jgi:regulatory protein YycH of two-component signal transduction system YycFG